MKIKSLLLALVTATLLVTTACNDGKPYKIIDGTIHFKTPERPAGQQDVIALTAEPLETVRVGFIGLGMRGPGAVKLWAQIPNTEIVALCDLRPEGIERAQKYLDRFNRPRAEVYTGSIEAWRELCQREDIDIVYIATDWENHAHMAKYAMECGKHVAIEVPSAMTLNEIWDLINTSERTRRHCMQLENCVYDYFELTTLNMAQQGLFGEILHAEGAYIHCLDNLWGRFYQNWRLRYNRDHRGDIYATHGIGPICQALNIHRGDRMKTLVAMNTKAVLGYEYWEQVTGEKYDGEFKNGDQTTTLISTENGKVMQIHHNVMTPRPYSRDYALVGTKGYATKYPVQGYLLHAEALGEVDHENLNSHKFLPEDIKAQMMEKYMHPITREVGAIAKKAGGHGGMDYIMIYRLVYCLRNGLPLDMDVYDLAEWCCLAELGAASIENGSKPVAVPDFTRGNWNKVDGYRHAMAE